MTPSRARQAGLAAAIALAGGVAANAAGLPLGWLIGALLACAAASIGGLPLGPPPYARELGQLIIGTGIGLKLSATVLLTALALAPYMLATTAYVIVITMLSAAALGRLAGIDGRTAFLATSSAGVMEMAVLAAQQKADPNAVALTQALRVSIIVMLVPQLVALFGQDGGLADAGALDPELGLPVLLALLAAGAAAAAGLQKLRGVPSPWLFGPLAVCTLGAIALGPTGGLPGAALIMAQLLLGMVLGCRFDRELLRRLPRIAAGGAAIALALIPAAGLGAWALSRLAGIPIETAFLAVAPAGIAEMVLTAKLLHLDAVTVMTFHLLRIVLVTAAAPALLGLYARLDPASMRAHDAPLDETLP